MDNALTTERLTIPAVSVALVRGRTILLVKRARAPSKGFYAFPGGRVETGESLEAAARRELMEETGLSAGPLTPVEEILIEGHDGDPPTAFLLTVFSGQAGDGEPVAGDDAEEAAFHTLEEVGYLPTVGSVLSIAETLLSKA